MTENAAADGIPLVVAHKGASAYRTGNTRASFDLAVAQGADCIELDVQSTADGEIVVYDRWYVDGPKQRHAVAELTLADLRRLHVDDAASDGQQLMTLAEVVAGLRPTRVEVLVELKNSLLRQPQNLGLLVADELRREGFLDRGLVFSFDHVLIASMGHSHRIRKGILYVARLVDLPAVLRATGAHFVEVRNDFIGQAMVEELHAAGRRVCGWSTDDPDELRRLRDIGVDMVTTDAPDKAREALALRNPIW